MARSISGTVTLGSASAMRQAGCLAKVRDKARLGMRLILGQALLETVDALLQTGEALGPRGPVARGRVDQAIEALDDQFLPLDQLGLASHQLGLAFDQLRLTVLEVFQPRVHELEELRRCLERRIDAREV